MPDNPPPTPSHIRKHQTPGRSLTVILAVTLTLISLWLASGQSRTGRWLVQLSYDTALDLSLPFTPPPDPSPVAIVYLDLPSYLQQQQDPAKPLDRTIYSRLLHRLTQAQTKAVVFDILFTEPGPTPQADIQLANAIRENQNVILGAELTTSSHATDTSELVRSLTLSKPITNFLAAAASWGLAYSQIDEDFVARQLFTGYPEHGRPSLTWATAIHLDLPVTHSPSLLHSTAYIRYYGRPQSAIPHVNLATAINPDAVDDNFFHNRVIFIGARPIAGGFLERRDELRSPLTGWTDPELFHPGVEVHATQMLNLIQQDWLRRTSPLLEKFAILFFGLSLPLTLLRLRPLPATTIAIASSTSLSALVIATTAYANLWSPWLIISLFQIPAALLASLLHQSLTWYRERQRLEQGRRAADQLIRKQAALIDKARDAILVTNLSAQPTYANPGTFNLYDCQPHRWNELQTHLATLLTSDPNQWNTSKNQTLHAGEWQGELHHLSLTGKQLTLQSRWTLLRTDSGHLDGILMINTDITEQKLIEAQLLRSQRMQTIGNLAGGMAHDLNNALAPVLMGVQLLQRRTTDDDTRRMLEVMADNTQRGADLVRQVLLFARGSQADFHTAQLTNTLQELERLLRETLPPNIKFHSLLPSDLWPVHHHPTQIHQILLNLCINARDAMPNGGTLSIAADNVDLTTADANLIPHARPGSFVMIMVADTGSGIPKEIQSRIFDPFFTTKPQGQGTGLGLSVVASVLKNHQSFLHLESEPESGSSFEIYLPKSAAATTIITRPTLIDLPRGNNQTILVIDDEQAIRDMLVTALKDQGYQPLTAANAAQALTRLHDHPQIQLVLLDHILPDQPGIQLLSDIHQQLPHLPAILASGSNNPELPDHLKTNPRIKLLSKPYPLEQLFPTLQQLLQSQ